MARGLANLLYHDYSFSVEPGNLIITHILFQDLPSHFFRWKVNVFCEGSEDGALHIGNEMKHPIVITETDGYVHLEYVITDILFQLKNLESKMISQQCLSVGDKKLDRLCFEVRSAQDKKPRKLDLYFDITAGYNC